jgi:hypothetical protein
MYLAKYDRFGILPIHKHGQKCPLRRLKVKLSFSVFFFLPTVDRIVAYLSPSYGPDSSKPENLGLLGILCHVDW